MLKKFLSTVNTESSAERVGARQWQTGHASLQIASASGAGKFPPWYDAGKVWLDQHPSFPLRKLQTKHPSLDPKLRLCVGDPSILKLAVSCTALLSKTIIRGKLKWIACSVHAIRAIAVDRLGRGQAVGRPEKSRQPGRWQFPGCYR